MKIIGCDFHASFQQIAMVDLQTEEYTERKLTPDEARQFYAELKQLPTSVVREIRMLRSVGAGGG